MKALVTGAGGLLGRVVARVLAAEHEVVPLTRGELDITDEVRVRAAVADARPGVIVNCAAYNAVDDAEDDAVAALAVNAFGVRALARAAAATDATLVHYSTDFVFDGTASEPYREDDAPNPQSVYAASKLLGDWFAQQARAYVLRVESLFGAVDGPSADGRRAGGSLARMADALLAGREVRAFVDRVVSPSHVDDVAAATAALLRATPAPGLYHCVGSGHATWFEVATALAGELGVEPTIRGVTLDELNLRAPRPRFCALSNRKLAAAGVEMPHWRDAVARHARALRRR
ncbi:MAG: dTDP-4-dehydrorhamnose reductase [Chloroflexi bacterium]|nr:dTDP-4-dehydrorhamnose reductase [Chloroflexota bacterium]